jgi:hypothetical protein
VVTIRTLQMETKQIEIDCPCCSTRLTIDVLTRKIMRAVSPAEIDETGKAKLDESRWDDATIRVEERVEDAQDKLESALSDERDKESRLDDLFDKARRKVRDRDEERDFEF